MVFTPLLTSACVGTLEPRSVALPLIDIQPQLKQPQVANTAFTVPLLHSCISCALHHIPNCAATLDVITMLIHRYDLTIALTTLLAVGAEQILLSGCSGSGHREATRHMC